jgi:hypothetical protein
MKAVLDALLKEPLERAPEGGWTSSLHKRPFRHQTILALIQRGWIQEAQQTRDADGALVRIEKVGHMTPEQIKEAQELGKWLRAKRDYYQDEPPGQDLKDIQAAQAYEKKHRHE